MAGKAPAAPAASRPAPSTRDTAAQAYTKAGGTGPPTRTGVARSAGTAAAGVDNGAGFLLALVFWGWIALPFVRGGPAAVRNVLRAKFFNKGPDGSWLP